MKHNLYSKPISSRLHIYSNQLHLTPTPSVALNISDQTYISKKNSTNSINKVEQNNTKKVSLPISLAERTGLEIEEPSRSIKKFDEVINQYINKKFNKRKQKNDFEKKTIITYAKLIFKISSTDINNTMQININDCRK